MVAHSRSTRGFTLIEMLVVLVIVGILSVVGVVMIGNRQAGSVRSLLDEIEGGLANAHKAAVATGRDVAIVSWGNWTADTPLVIAHGDATLTNAQIQATANGLLVGTQPAATLVNGQTVAVAFHLVPNDSTYSRARIAIFGTGEWNQAKVDNTDIATVSPFKAGETMLGLSADLYSFCQPVPNRVEISGTNKRFTTTFIIRVVGTTSAGPLPGGPMGLIVVLANGATIYKFYNAGSRAGNNQWRRI